VSAKKDTGVQFHGVGRRKSSVARVWLRPGKGDVVVNGKKYDTYFTTESARMAVEKPFVVIEQAKMYDAHVSVCGGGITGQADATKLGISRAILASDENFRKQLRAGDLLTVDARVVERKKYGQSGARRKFQFVKR
jgi:small subunit ribosomal protein S9